MHPPPHLRQQSAEGRTRTVAQGCRILPFQHGIHIGSGHQAGTRLSRFHEAEAGADQFFGRRYAVKFPVGLLDGGFFLLAEPVAFAPLYLVLQLRVKLSVVDGRGAVDGTLHLHADEAAAAAQVRQQVQAVARADERGDAGRGSAFLL